MFMKDPHGLAEHRMAVAFPVSWSFWAYGVIR